MRGGAPLWPHTAVVERGPGFCCFALMIALVPWSELHGGRDWKEYNGIRRINSDQWLCSAASSSRTKCCNLGPLQTRGSALAQVCARLTTGLTPSSRPRRVVRCPGTNAKFVSTPTEHLDVPLVPLRPSPPSGARPSSAASTTYGQVSALFWLLPAYAVRVPGNGGACALFAGKEMDRSPARSPPALASYFRAVHIDTKSLDDTPGGADIAMTRLWNRSPSLKTPRLSSWFLPRHYKPNYWSKRRSIRRIQALTPSSQQRCPLHFGCFLTPHEIEPGGLGSAEFCLQRGKRKCGSFMTSSRLRAPEFFAHTRPLRNMTSVLSAPDRQHVDFSFGLTRVLQ
ncbi:hypothetical protein B0H14DRAFT_3520030 [Mycena olivaceomarginata]|nr:hypothetical protein B0H14DRAFT_3520030 [Mycena olivaceomarginata]